MWASPPQSDSSYQIQRGQRALSINSQGSSLLYYEEEPEASPEEKLPFWPVKSGHQRKSTIGSDGSSSTDEILKTCMANLENLCCSDSDSDKSDSQENATNNTEENLASSLIHSN